MIIEKNSCTLSRKSVQKVFGGDFFSFTACFTLIELLVITAQHCRHFIHNSCFASAKTCSLFLKRREGCGERGIIEADGRPFPVKRSFSSHTDFIFLAHLLKLGAEL